MLDHSDLDTVVFRISQFRHGCLGIWWNREGCETCTAMLLRDSILKLVFGSKRIFQIGAIFVSFERILKLQNFHNCLQKITRLSKKQNNQFIGILIHRRKSHLIVDFIVFHLPSTSTAPDDNIRFMNFSDCS